MKKLLHFVGILLLVISTGYFLYFASNSFSSLLCENEVISSTVSPDGLKKVVVFTVNCGATSGWTTQASIVDASYLITNSDRGTALSLDSNNGKAWPLAIGGWPLIVPEWSGLDSVTLHYSSNANPSEKHPEVGGVQVMYQEITPEFIENSDLKVR